MASSTPHKYFLSIEGMTIVFPEYLGFKNMTSFGKLSLFTGVFTEEKELLNALKNLDLIQNQQPEGPVEIVRKSGNKKKGYYYESIDDSLLYKSASRFLSEKSVIEFFHINRRQTDILKKFLGTYLDEVIELIRIFEERIESLESYAYSLEHDKRSRALEELKRRHDSLGNFREIKANIQITIQLLIRMSNDTHDKEVELEYHRRIRTFVNLEAHYKIGRKRTINFRNLVRLANLIDSFLKTYGVLVPPPPDNFFISEKINMLNRYKKALETVVEERRAIHQKKVNESDEETPTDPDSFMFLEDEDFNRLERINQSEAQKESIEADVENHQTRKKLR